MPEPPPKLHEPLVFSGREALHDLFRLANKDYLYWDKFKHRSMPDGVKAEEAWGLLSFIRNMNRRHTPVKDKSGTPFTYWRTDEVDRVLHVVDKHAGGNVSTTVERLSSQEKRRYLVNSLMEEAIASSQLEGAVTTRRAAKEMLRSNKPPQSRADSMILNNYRTVTRIRGLLDEPLTVEVLVSLQAMLTTGAIDRPEDSGRLRDESDDIIVAADAGSGGEILHVPPSAHSLMGELEALCEYANSDDETFEHPILKAVILHFWLAYLHPFADGNGRTARALFYLHMLKQGYWVFEYLSISRIIKDRRGSYYRSFLYSEMDHCDLTYFITFNLHAVEQALSDLWEYLERKSSEESRLIALLERDRELNHRQRAILSRALKEPDAVFLIDTHQASHLVSYATARADLLDLANQGYLRLNRRGRQYTFVASDNLPGLLGDA